VSVDVCARRRLYGLLYHRLSQKEVNGEVPERGVEVVRRGIWCWGRKTVVVTGREDPNGHPGLTVCLLEGLFDRPVSKEYYHSFVY
jgi:hypothetical protein